MARDRRSIRSSRWPNRYHHFFLVVGITCIQPENWTPFAPNGLKGISAAEAIIFFAYIGFDAVSTASEETRKSPADMPVGIIGSLAICTVLYVAVANRLNRYV